VLVNMEMIDTDTSGLIWTRQRGCGQREALLQYVPHSWRGDELAVDSYLPDTVRRGIFSPPSAPLGGWLVPNRLSEIRSNWGLSWVLHWCAPWVSNPEPAD